MDISGELVGFWWRKFWWLRGVVAAFTILSVVPAFTDLSQYTILRAIHAVIFTWNETMAWVGQLLNYLPFLPELPPNVVNAILFSLSVLIPINLGILKQTFKSMTFMNSIAASRWKVLNGIVAHIVVAFFSLMAVTLLFFPDVADRYFGFFLPGGRESRAFFMFTTFFNLACFLYLAVKQLPAFGRSLIWTLSFLAVFELLYVLNTPLITYKVDQFACEKLEIEPTDC